jgi:hypothetical protein
MHKTNQFMNIIWYSRALESYSNLGTSTSPTRYRHFSKRYITMYSLALIIVALTPKVGKLPLHLRVRSTYIVASHIFKHSHISPYADLKKVFFKNISLPYVWIIMTDPLSVTASLVGLARFATQVILTT